jgi:hypothetical protein
VFHGWLEGTHALQSVLTAVVLGINSKRMVKLRLTRSAGFWNVQPAQRVGFIKQLFGGESIVFFDSFHGHEAGERNCIRLGTGDFTKMRIEFFRR